MSGSAVVWMTVWRVKDFLKSSFLHSTQSSSLLNRDEGIKYLYLFIFSTLQYSLKILYPSKAYWRDILLFQYIRMRKEKKLAIDMRDWRYWGRFDVCSPRTGWNMEYGIVEGFLFWRAVLKKNYAKGKKTCVGAYVHSVSNLLGTPVHQLVNANI